MPAVDTMREQLAGRQNPDGGWGYRAGSSSWSEPTALAVLALNGWDDRSQQVRRGVEWLRRLVRADGGVAPCPGVQQSNWVTALAVLAESVTGGIRADAAPVRWLLDRSGEESRLITRLRMWLLGVKWDVDSSPHGWPWGTGSSAWVVPTAWTIIALQHVYRRHPEPEIQERLQHGRKFLLSRQCRDGGWNYGASRALGYDADSYPETTGIALLALRGERSAAVVRAVDRAMAMAPACSSNDAYAWLTLGLAAHGRPIPESVLTGHHSTPELALHLLASRTVAGKGLWS